jgi:hypothetical protein
MQMETVVMPTPRGGNEVLGFNNLGVEALPAKLSRSGQARRRSSDHQSLGGPAHSWEITNCPSRSIVTCQPELSVCSTMDGSSEAGCAQSLQPPEVNGLACSDHRVAVHGGEYSHFVPVDPKCDTIRLVLSEVQENCVS